MKKKIYCVYCGTENKLEDKKCVKCNKRLDPKENLFIDYLKDHIKDDIKGKTQDKIINIIINYIKSHLYGFILTMSLIITSTLVIMTTLDNQSYELVNEPPSIASCTPKKFDKNYSYAYTTKEECISEGNNAFIEVYENIDDTIFTYSCEEIIDDCGTTWYGVYFNQWGEGDQIIKVYY